ncbi:SICAvar type I [Plasmodium knowlesi]|uniref:SICAvar type I n=2 Tax=Plasmodium knowlesi TaxID=5850 RepID=A0A1Y3DVS4_PLAKN|nr:SICAvar type I [Plasmodium knowlesi]
MCDRLECMKHLWTQTDPATAAVSSNKDFWEDNGAVKKLWDELSNAMRTKGTEEQTECKTVVTGTTATPSEEAACKFLHAGLNQLYNPTPATPPSASSPSGDDVLKNNPSFRQTMGCFLLHAYAKIMKEKATCLIDDGISKAFELGENLGTNGIKCKWDVDTFKGCEIEKNGATGEKENVENKLKDIIDKDGNDPKMKQMAQKINEVTKLCDQVQCVTTRWMEQNKSSVKGDWEDVWKEVPKEIKALAEGTNKNKRKEVEDKNYCNGLSEGKGKDACILIAAGLKNLYDINESDAVDVSFQRTMQCVLLNAIADRLEDEKFPCTDEKNVKKGIEHAFGKIDNIMNGSKCSGNDKCFKCPRVKNYDNCEIKTDGGSEEKLKDKINPKVEAEYNEDSTTSTSPLSKKSLTTTICKPCEEGSNGDKCQRLKCIVQKWGDIRNYGNSVPSWDRMKTDFGNDLTRLMNHMRTEAENAEVTKHCNDGVWNNGDAAGVANKTACKLVAAGLHHISNIKHTYKPQKNNGDYNPYDNQEFHQFVSCLWLKRVVQEMEKRSISCDIKEGIKKGSKAWNTIKETHCKNQPCIECNLEDDYGKLDTCQVGSDSANVKEKFIDLLTKDKTTEADSTLQELLKTDKNGSLCQRLQCLASRVEALKKDPSSNANDFWKKGGEVDKLWNELSNAMRTNGDKDNGNVCGQMEDGSATNGGTASRQATDPERKACQHLTAGFNQLKENPSSKDSNYPILKNNPLLRQTVGCFLLKEYAKKMQNQSTCVITSGLEKAFKSWKPEKNGRCASGIACIDCNWDDNEYDSCDVKITTNGTPSNAKTAVGTVLDEKKNELKSTMDKINDTKTLCQQLQCAAPRWFERNKVTKQNGTDNRTWCEFWNEGVKPELTNLFTAIQTDGKGKSNTITTARTCQGFGYGNTDSVERKACNYIAAGLQHIKGITGSSNGVAQSNDQYKELLDRAVACIALNMYADQIREKSKDKCPIDESKIQRMFDFWNAINNNSCLTSASRANNKNCFVCKRLQGSYFADCNLSVSNTLVDTTSPQSGSRTTCTDKDNNTNKNVSKKIDDLLKEESKMEGTLKEINKMNDFCTQLQCAARKWKLANSKNGQIGTLSWDDINLVVNEELKKLLEHITDDQKWESVAQHCNGSIGSSTDDTPGEKKAKQKACKLFALGLKHISDIKDKNQNDDVVPLKQTMMCAALNLYADQLITKAKDQCPLDGTKLTDAIQHAFNNSKTIMNGGASCKTGSTNSCFVCKREEKTFHNCQIGQNQNDKVKPKLESLLKDNDKTNPNNMDKTLEEINKIETFCTQVQCAIKQYGKSINNKTGPNGTVSWSDIDKDAKDELTELLDYMIKPDNQKDVAEYCKDKEDKWNAMGHKEGKTNKAACLLFASGLKHIYTHGIVQKNGQVKDHVKGPSFEQTMGCLFLKEYAKQLKKMAEEQKKYRVHPNCSVDSGIDHAFEKSKVIMQASSQCKKNVNNDCFECDLNKGYDKCSIGDDDVGNKAKNLFEGESEQNHMQQTLENTVCPILLTDILTPFLPLAPVSIGLSAMAYYLWKYFGPLGKGGPRFRRSPAEIPGSSIQEHLLDHVEEAGPHEYQLVKERKPRSAPTRTKRSGPVNRRTIIEIHFEVLDECQKGDTQVNQKDFLELLVQEFMGSELMEEEQVPKEELFMEGVPMEEVPMESIPLEQVPMERVPNLGSGFMV